MKRPIIIKQYLLISEDGDTYVSWGVNKAEAVLDAGRKSSFKTWKVVQLKETIKV